MHYFLKIVHSNYNKQVHYIQMHTSIVKNDDLLNENVYNSQKSEQNIELGHNVVRNRPFWSDFFMFKYLNSV